MTVAHALTHRAKVQAPSLTRSTYGGSSATWVTTVPNLRCRIVTLRTEERVLNDQAEPEITHRMFCNPRMPIREDCQIVFGARTLEVKTVVDEDEANRFMMVELRERKTQGPP